MIWRCPYCIGSLHDEYASLRCGACCRTFPVFDGIPDLRTAHPSWIDLTAEHSYARKLLAEQMEASPEEWVRRVFADQTPDESTRIALRTRQVMAGPQRLRGQLAGWLRSCVAGNGLFLDAGCGAGVLLAGAALEGRRGIGIDVSLVWLLVAARLVRAVVIRC